MHQIGIGIALYGQDYDEKFPPAKSWTDVVQPYLKETAIFNCPALPRDARYGYALNSKLSNKPLDMISSPTVVVAVYETSILKPQRLRHGENPAFRHLGGANFLSAAGYVHRNIQGKTPRFNLKP
jgi:hypothetical protein